MVSRDPAHADVPVVVSAGAVVLRRARTEDGRKAPKQEKGAREVLLVHRPKYDDWSFPKGKRDPGEHVTESAVREVLEETGVRVRLARPLLPQSYVVAGNKSKTVHYWVGRSVGDDDVSRYRPNQEIDGVAWVGLEEAMGRLSYLDDVNLVEQVLEHPQRTTTLVVQRHVRACSRKRWGRADRLRPATRVGKQQAVALVPVLAAYGAIRVVSSDSVRCMQTVAPYTAGHGLQVEGHRGLSEEHASDKAVAAILDDIAAHDEPTVLCTHRPVLPRVFAHLDLEDPRLSPGEMMVVHRRRGSVVATERHLPR